MSRTKEQQEVFERVSASLAIHVVSNPKAFPDPRTAGTHIGQVVDGIVRGVAPASNASLWSKESQFWKEHSEIMNRPGQFESRLAQDPPDLPARDRWGRFVRTKKIDGQG